jgi:hypothetical protein
MSEVHRTDHPVLDQPIVLKAGSDETLPLLAFNQRSALLDQAVRALNEGRRPKITVTSDISTSDLIRSMLNDADNADVANAALAILSDDVAQTIVDPTLWLWDAAIEHCDEQNYRSPKEHKRKDPRSYAGNGQISYEPPSRKQAA